MNKRDGNLLRQKDGGRVSFDLFCRVCAWTGLLTLNPPPQLNRVTANCLLSDSVVSKISRSHRERVVTKKTTIFRRFQPHDGVHVEQT